MYPCTRVAFGYGDVPLTGGDGDTSASEDEAAYMARIKAFLVPEVDTPAPSSACSVPGMAGLSSMQLGTSTSGASGPDDPGWNAAFGVDTAASNTSNNLGKAADDDRDNTAWLSELQPPKSESPVKDKNYETDASADLFETAEAGKIQRTDLFNGMDGAPTIDHLLRDQSQGHTDGPQSHERVASVVGPNTQGGVESAMASQSSGVTADVERLLDMSLTDNADSISSPLLTPEAKLNASAEGYTSTRPSPVEASTVSPKLAGAANQATAGIKDHKSSFEEISKPVLACALSHATPIAAIQTTASKFSGSFGATSRIPSSSRRLDLQSESSSTKLPAFKTSFSFASHSSQEAATPKAIGAHPDMWSMAEVASAAPQLVLSQVADHNVDIQKNVEGYVIQLVANVENPPAMGGMFDGAAISALTPVANEALVSGTDTGMAISVQQNALAQAKDKSHARPPAHPQSQPKTQYASRIPSRRTVRNLAVPTECTTPTVQRCHQQSNKKVDTLPNLMPGSVEPPTVAGCHPTNSTGAAPTSSDTAEDPMIGTPPYAKLMRFLNQPSQKLVCESLPGKAEASSCPEGDSSPLLPQINVVSSTMMCTGMTPDSRPFSQLLKNIQADRYCSPAVNCAAFHNIQQGGNPPIDSASSSPPPDDSPSTVHSEIGENYPDQSDVGDISLGQARSPVNAAQEPIADGICCSRVSAAGSAAGAVSEQSVDLFSKAAMKIILGNGQSPITSGTALADHSVASPTRAPYSPVVVTLTEQGDDAGQVKVSMSVRDGAEACDSAAVPPLALPLLREDFSKYAESGHSAQGQQNAIGELRDSTAISCTVNIGEITPRSPDEAAGASSVPESIPESPGTDVCNFTAPADAVESPSHSLSVAGANEACSPPHLTISLESVIHDHPANPNPNSAVSPELKDGVPSPIMTQSPEPAASIMTPPQSPVIDHIEMMKDMIRLGQFVKTREDSSQQDNWMPESLGTPQTAKMVEDIKGSFKTPDSVSADTPGSSIFPEFLNDNGIGSAITPGGVPYCVMGGLWKQKRQIEKEFQGWKAVELENAAETEQQHADDIRKLQEENAMMHKKANEADHRAHLLAEELGAVRQQLADVQAELQSLKVGKPDAHEPTADNVATTSNPSATVRSEEDDIRISEVIANVKSLEELMERVRERSCTQNNIAPTFVQIYSYFHQLQTRLQSGRLRSIHSSRDSVDNVDALVNWAKPPLEELCEHYDQTASEVTRRSVDIARLRKTGFFAGCAVKEHEHENSNLHEHLQGVSVSMRFHMYEVCSRLNKIGGELMSAMKSLGDSEQLDPCMDTVEMPAEEPADRSTCKRDFSEPLSLMLRRRAQDIQGQLENVSITLHGRSCIPQSHSIPPMRANSGAAQAGLAAVESAEGAVKTPRLDSTQGWPDVCLTTPAKTPTHWNGYSSKTSALRAAHSSSKPLVPFLNMDNPLFNATPETGLASSSDAPPSFAPPDSADSLAGLAAQDAELLTSPMRGLDHATLGDDENSPNGRVETKGFKVSKQYPSKDRIEFICHALNMGISPFARRNHEV